MAVKHEEIAHELRQAIRAGEYPPGSTIPALPELMRRYGVARNTVRDAVNILTQEGLVTPQQGVGTVVRDTTPTRSHPAARGDQPDLARLRSAGQDRVEHLRSRGFSTVRVRRLSVSRSASVARRTDSPGP